jgi:branched-chain amino acid transport system permease protein
VRRALWPAAAIAGGIGAFAGAQPATLVARGCAFGLAVASLVVLTGWSGQLNLHVAAIGMGWGAYATAALVVNHVPPLLAILIAPLIVVPAALIVGAIAVRFRGPELAVATLALGLAFEQMVFQNIGKWLGRLQSATSTESSVVAISRPHAFEGDRAFALLALVFTAIWIIAAAYLGRGRSGRALRAVRDREIVAEARGVPVFSWRVAALVFSIVIAAAGGGLLAVQSGAVVPETFGFNLSLQLLAVATVCGIARLEAMIFGAAVIIVAQEAGGVPVLNLLSGQRANLVFGVGLIVVLAFRGRKRERPGELLARGQEAGREPDLLVHEERPFTATILRVEDVSLAFGPHRILDGVDLRVGEGEVCGLVGGNGAGKTTLFNVITGLVQPAGGRVFLGGTDVTDMPPHRRAQLGLARTFQGVEVFEGLSVEEGLLVAAELHTGRRDREAARARVHDALATVGLGPIEESDPATLPLEVLRLVEIAQALVVQPKLVLLDEPLAGLDDAERKRVLATIRDLRAQGRAVLIVEHDRDAVAQIADRIYELRDGRAHTLVRPEAKPKKGRGAPKARRGGRVAARA